MLLSSKIKQESYAGREWSLDFKIRIFYWKNQSACVSFCFWLITADLHMEIGHEPKYSINLWHPSVIIFSQCFKVLSFIFLYQNFSISLLFDPNAINNRLKYRRKNRAIDDDCELPIRWPECNRPDSRYPNRSRNRFCSPQSRNVVISPVTTRGRGFESGWNMGREGKATTFPLTTKLTTENTKLDKRSPVDGKIIVPVVPVPSTQHLVFVLHSTTEAAHTWSTSSSDKWDSLPLADDRSAGTGAALRHISLMQVLCSLVFICSSCNCLIRTRTLLPGKWVGRGCVFVYVSHALISLFTRPWGLAAIEGVQKRLRMLLHSACFFGFV